MLVHDALRVLYGHVPSTELHHLGAQFYMSIVKNSLMQSLFHGFSPPLMPCGRLRVKTGAAPEKAPARPNDLNRRYHFYDEKETKTIKNLRLPKDWD